jgi:uncharacterized membrane protein SirB2
MGQLFDVPHLLYIFISLSLTVLLLVLAYKYFKTQTSKDRFLKFCGLITFFLHISVLWVDFLGDGSASVPDNILFPKYFCNFMMYMLLITAFLDNKKSKTFQAVAIITAYGGFYGAMISLFYPDYYLGSPSMLEWGVLKSMLSHSTMLLGSVWILVGNFVSIRPSNAIVYTGGLLGCGVIGVIVNYLFEINGLYDPNAMYLHQPPLSDVPFFNCWTIAGLMVLLILAFTWIYAKAGKKKPSNSPSKFAFFR